MEPPSIDLRFAEVIFLTENWIVCDLKNKTKTRRTHFWPYYMAQFSSVTAEKGATLSNCALSFVNTPYKNVFIIIIN